MREKGAAVTGFNSASVTHVLVGTGGEAAVGKLGSRGPPRNPEWRSQLNEV